MTDEDRAYDDNPEYTMGCMRPEQFFQEMKHIQQSLPYDVEVCHIEMDNLMCKLLTDLGYTRGIKIYYDTDKWYA